MMNRRSFVLGSGLMILLAGPGFAQQGEWTFVDDRGRTITLPSRPLRIAASYPVLTALWEYGVHPIGLIAHRKPADLPGLAQAGVDMNQVALLKDAVDGWNLEAVLAAEPDLIITHVTESGLLWGIGDDDAIGQRLEEIAPILALRGDVPVEEGIARHLELAKALGAPDTAPPGKDAFDAVTEALRTAAAAKPDLKLLVVSAGDTSLFTVSTGPSFPDLAYLTTLGVNVVDGGNEDLSWEEAGKYAADVLVTDDRDGVPQLDIATWTRLPAVMAGQVYPVWRYQPPYSYFGYARAYAGILDILQTAEVVTP